MRLNPFTIRLHAVASRGTGRFLAIVICTRHMGGGDGDGGGGLGGLGGVGLGSGDGGVGGGCGDGGSGGGGGEGMSGGGGGQLFWLKTSWLEH
jgi:hypothetical protein